MATSTTSPDRSSRRSHAAPRKRSWLRICLYALLAVAVAAAAALLALRAARAGTVLPGVSIAGVEVGGRSGAQLEAAVAELAADKAAVEVSAIRDDEQYAGVAGDLGYRLDQETTAAAARYRGRQGNPLIALSDHVRAFFEPTPLEPVESVDDEQLLAWAQAAGEELVLAPREGALRFDGAQITRVEPRAGAEVIVEDLVADTRPLLLSGEGGEVPVAVERIGARTTRGDLDQAEVRARQAVSAPVTFTRSGAEATLDPDDIGSALRSRVTTDQGDAAIVLGIRPPVVTERLGQEAIAAFESQPQNASVRLSGGEIVIEPSSDGFRYDQRTAARQLLAVATADGPRTVELNGEVVEPELSTTDAEALKIRQQISSFTTEHECCQSRVTNIHRIADMVHGVVILPGETFSVNGYVGERTEAKGFVGGGAIFDGEFVEQIGGGVSQFATTLYNAAYFGGYAIPEYKAHSYYISRYPEGREATLNYPNVDLKIFNNSPHGMLLATSYTDTSITVSVWASPWVEVDSETGPRRNVRMGSTQYREDDTLPKGSSQVVQEAGIGFDVTVTRILRFPDGRTEYEPVTTSYTPQPRIVRRNT